MSIKDEIRELNRTENAGKLNRLCCRLISGRVRFNGVPVYFDYRDMRDFFCQCDPTIDESRFDELMQIADYAQ